MEDVMSVLALAGFVCGSIVGWTLASIENDTKGQTVRCLVVLAGFVVCVIIIALV